LVLLGLHSTEAALELLAQQGRLGIAARTFYSGVAVLIDEKPFRSKQLLRPIHLRKKKD